MNIILNNSSMVPIYEQLIDQIKSAIINGDLKEGSILPSVRMLAGDLKISALTVKKAYDRLEEESFIVTVHGKGSYVSRINASLAQEMNRLEVEKQFDEAITKAKASGMSNEEIMQLVNILLEDTND